MRTLHLLVLALAAGTAAAQPNILLVYTDDQRSDELETMRHVSQRLVDEGLSFTRYVATTPKCGPSRASLLRGQYAHNHGLIGHKNWPGGAYKRWVDTGLGEATLGTWLQGAGYRTAYIGKHQTSFPLDSDPSYIDPGWDEWLVPWTKRTPGTYYQRTFSDNGQRRLTGPGDYTTDVMGERLVQFMGQSIRDGDPFFAVFAPFAPHADHTIRRHDGNVVGPPRPADRHVGLFADRTGPRYPSHDEGDVGDKPPTVAANARLEAREVARIDTVYRARIESLLAVDQWVGRALRVLERQGALDNTYVVYASDNGFMLGEHRVRPERKSNMPYREVIELPLVIRGPGVAVGASTDAIAANIDLAPTILEWAGVALPDHLDGRSLAPVLSGQTGPWRDAVLAERWETNSAITYRSLHTSSAKYTDWRAEGVHEFYNHDTDPYELDNAAHLLAPTLLDSLRGAVDDLFTCAGATCRQADLVPWAHRLAEEPRSAPAVEAVVEGPKGPQYFGPPVEQVSVEDLAALNLVRGLPGLFPGTSPTLWTSYDPVAGTWRPTDDRHAVLPRGRAFKWRFLDRDGVGRPDVSQSVASPFLLTAPGYDDGQDVAIVLDDRGDRYNFLANPFARPLDLSGLAGWLGGRNVVGPAYIYDPVARGWQIATGPVGPWGAFRVRARRPRADGGVRRIVVPYAATGPGETASRVAAPALTFTLSGVDTDGVPLADGSFRVAFSGRSVGFDPEEDGEKPAPESEAFVALGALDSTTPALVELCDLPPRPGEIVLGVDAREAAPVLRLSWAGALPAGLSATLTDRVTGRTVDVGVRGELTFEMASRPGPRSPLGGRASASDAAPRFVLRLGTGDPTLSGAPALALRPPAPNPSRAGATLAYALATPGPHTLSIVDARGRTVAVLADGAAAAGEHVAAMPEGLAPGIYLVRLAAEGRVLTRSAVVVR